MQVKSYLLYEPPLFLDELYKWLKRRTLMNADDHKMKIDIVYLKLSVNFYYHQHKLIKVFIAILKYQPNGPGQTDSSGQ